MDPGAGRTAGEGGAGKATSAGSTNRPDATARAAPSAGRRRGSTADRAAGTAKTGAAKAAKEPGEATATAQAGAAKRTVISERGAAGERADPEVAAKPRAPKAPARTLTLRLPTLTWADPAPRRERGPASDRARQLGEEAGRGFARLTVLPALVMLAWLLPGLLLLLGGEFTPVPMLLIAAPLATALAVNVLHRIPGSWPLDLPGRVRERSWTALFGILGTEIVAALFAAWQLLRSSPSVIDTRTPGAYFQAGYWIAQHGSLVIPGSLHAFGGPHPGLHLSSIGFTAVGGSVVPAVTAGLPMLLAGGFWTSGTGGGEVIAPILGGLAVLSFGGLVGRLAGRRWAPAGALALALTLPELYTSRDAFAEPAVQILLFGGMSLVIDALTFGRRAAGAAAPAAGLPDDAGAADDADGTLETNATDAAMAADRTARTDGSAWADEAVGIDEACGTDRASEAREASETNSADGTDGASEANGVSGTESIKGAEGASGTESIKGAEGASGTEGAGGANGAGGPEGADEADGPDGAGGELELVRARALADTPTLELARIPLAGSPDLPSRAVGALTPEPMLAGLGGLCLGLTSLLSLASLVYLVPVIVVAGVLVVARRKAGIAFCSGVAVGCGYGMAAAYLLARPLADSGGPTLRVIGEDAGGVLLLTVAVLLLRLQPRWLGAVRRVLVRLPLRWLPGLAAVLLVAAVAVLAVRPYFQTVRGALGQAEADYVASLQRIAGLKVDPTRLYSEDTLYWVIWYAGIPTLLLGTFGAAVLLRRCLRSLLAWQDASGTGLNWALPLSVVVGGSAAVLWQPFTLPDQPWASRRLVPVVIPGLILLGTWAAAWLTRRARDRGAGLATAAAVGAFCVAAMALPSVTTSFGVGLSHSGPGGGLRASAGGLAQHSVGVGEDTAVRDLCASLGRSSSVLIVDQRTAEVFGQVIRGMCGVPVAWMGRRSSQAQVDAVLGGILRTGRRPVVLGAKPGQVGAFGGTPMLIMNLVTTQSPHTLTQPPGAPWPARYVIWMAVASPTGVGI